MPVVDVRAVQLQMQHLDIASHQPQWTISGFPFPNRMMLLHSLLPNILLRIHFRIA